MVEGGRVSLAVWPEKSERGSERFGEDEEDVGVLSLG
jgi:hypothetical protein